MKKKEVNVVNHWKDVLVNYINPLELIKNLPTIFQYGSRHHESVYNVRGEKHKAVTIALQIITEHDIMLDELIDAIEKSGSEWLAMLVKGDIPDSDVEAQIARSESLEEIRRFLTLIAPHIEEAIIAVAVAHDLRCQHVITEGEYEQVESKSKYEGNTIAVIELLSHLVRKTNPWLESFVEILKNHNYEEALITSLMDLICDTSSLPSSRYLSVHQQTHTEGKSVDCGAEALVSTPRAKNAANFGNSPHKLGNMDLRSYQVSLSRKAAEGKNVIICAPTGSGKTRVAAHVIVSNLKNRHATKPKAAFLVPTVGLAEQQSSNMRPVLKSVNIRIDCLVGNSRASLKDVLRANQVIVMTPQILLNSLNDGSVSSICEFVLLIFDECHRAMSDTPYNQIMSYYLNCKKNRGSSLPQVIGLTATLGVGKGTTEDSALDHMLTLCANLDATSGIVTVPPEHQKELSEYTASPEHENVELKKSSDPFSLCLCLTIDKQMEQLRTLELDGVAASIPDDLPKGDARFIQWCQEYKAKAINSVLEDSKIRDLQLCLKHIRLFNLALDLYFKCRAVDSIEYLHENMPQSSTSASTMESRLMHLAYETMVKLEGYANDPRCQNMDLKKIADEKIKNLFLKNSNSRVMFFVRKRQYAQAITKWLNEEMAGLEIKVEFLTGIGHSSDKKIKGLTHREHERVLGSFRTGTVKVLVCTPEVASEGLDIVDCNLVICYDYEKNEISKTQVAGRVRQKNGKIIEVASRVMLARDSLNIKKTQLMDETVTRIQEMYDNRKADYDKKLETRQRLRLRQMDVSVDKVSMLNGMPPSAAFKVVCESCNTFVCNGQDIVRVGTYYTSVDKKFPDRYCEADHNDRGTEAKKIFKCKICNTKWGIFVNYNRLRGIPHLSPGSLRFIRIHKNAACSDISASKWVKVKISIQDVSEDYIREKLYND